MYVKAARVREPELSRCRASTARYSSWLRTASFFDRQWQARALQAIEIDLPGFAAMSILGQHPRLEEHAHHGLHQPWSAARHAERSRDQLRRGASFTAREQLDQDPIGALGRHRA